MEVISETEPNMNPIVSFKRRIRRFLYGMVREYVLEDVRSAMRKHAKRQFDPEATAVLKRFSHLLRGHGINRERVETEISLSSARCGTAEGSGIVVSLTSYPKRIYDIHLSLQSLLMQTLRPEKIVLWLGEELFPRHEADVPKKTLDLRSRGLEIRFTHDCRAFTKLLPALAAFPEKTIVTADDDIYYDPDWLERLVAAAKQDPRAVWAIRAQKIGVQGDVIQDCLKWRTMTEGSMPRYDNFLTGVGGVLYPPHSLAMPLCADERLFMSLAPLNDDVWFWAMAVMNGTGVGVADGFPGYLTYVNKPREYGFNDDGRLYAVNKGENMHNIQFAAVLEHFPELREKLMGEIRSATIAHS